MLRGRLRPAAWGLAVLAAIALLAIVGLASKHSPAAGRPAPSLPTEHLAGPPVPSFNAGGRSKIVVFWASWCEPCVQEAPAVRRVSQSATGRGRVIGVDWNDSLSGARSFIKSQSWTFPNVRDGEGTVGSAYRLIGLPTTFIVDSHGHIRAMLSGPQSEGSLTRALGANGGS
ncbi:MAG TPA: TlpA disulfide reductase family protein [Solirubrobacteraceae bacterium]|nr:TlpA disulfide reductase family protein [Solirubrobacteraceae bacterium]